MQSHNRRYLKELAPMSLSDMVMALGDPIIIFVLASLPNSTLNLAAFALGKAIAVFFESPIISVLPVSNMMSAAKKSREVLFTFVVTLGVTLTISMSVLALLPEVSSLVFIQSEVWQQASLMVLLLCPWPLMIAVRRYWQGQMIHAGQSTQIAKGAILRCLVLISIAFSVSLITSSGPLIVAGALLCGVLAELIYVRYRVSRIKVIETETQHALPTEMISMGRYYWPLAQSMITLWGARLMLPILITFLGEQQLAAWAAIWVLVISISNGVRMLQQLVIRHLQAIPDSEHVAERNHLRQFALLVGIGFSFILGLLAFSPLGSSLLLLYVSGDEQLANTMRPVLLVLFTMPMLMAIQHYLMGLLMLKNATNSIGKAALAANVYMVIGVAAVVWFNLPLYIIAIQVILAMCLEITLLGGAMKTRKLETIQTRS
ncbi:hypothetical protein F0225_16515 [Vibrio pectenicida]|uniref:Lipopolysaccharide biosynthesis protein n=1 Tax=Vibrio pectenicida TaxID=62763 RepID=A0A7Y4A1C5_9VIBR|nr:hypothetical protein [Vibrio pectenicida]NOH72932.1 hypothetical protein [Vibrio pectenicida]